MLVDTVESPVSRAPESHATVTVVTRELPEMPEAVTVP